MLLNVVITGFEVLSIQEILSSVKLVFVFTSWADIIACSRVATCVHISPRQEDNLTIMTNDIVKITKQFDEISSWLTYAMRNWTMPSIAQATQG
jgi:hypothetical protein